MDDALLENEVLSDIESVTEDNGMIEYRRFKKYITPYNTKSMVGVYMLETSVMKELIFQNSPVQFVGRSS